MIAYFHSHGAEFGRGVCDFSDHDIRTARTLQVDGYVITPCNVEKQSNIGGEMQDYRVGWFDRRGPHRGQHYTSWGQMLSVFPDP